jgi:molybdopterin synthase catalytic subunit
MATSSTTHVSGEASPQPAAIQIALETQNFQPLEALAAWQAGQSPPAAEAQFIGRVRGSCADGSPLRALELEHYPGMTERLLAQLALAAAQRHGASAVLVVHRVGLVAPAQAIVLVAVAADRRGPAQRCCGELLEALKHEAPFWKREWGASCGQWLQGNTPL